MCWCPPRFKPSNRTAKFCGTIVWAGHERGPLGAAHCPSHPRRSPPQSAPPQPPRACRVSLVRAAESARGGERDRVVALLDPPPRVAPSSPSAQQSLGASSERRRQQSALVAFRWTKQVTGIVWRTTRGTQTQLVEPSWMGADHIRGRGGRQHRTLSLALQSTPAAMSAATVRGHPC